MKIFYIILMTLLSAQAMSQAVWIAPALPAGPKSWQDGANWSTGAPPGAGQSAIFDGTSNIACRLDADVVISNIIISGFTGNINMNGWDMTIQPGGNNSFLSGNIVGTGDIVINSTGSATFDGTTLGPNVTLTATLTTATGIFTGGPGTTFGGLVNITAVSILLNGSTYESTTTLNKSGAVSVASLGNGGNTFNGTTSIINSMNNFFRTGNVAGNTDTFNGPVTLNLNGTNSGNIIQLSHTVGTHTDFNNNVRIRSNNNASMSQSCGVGCITNATLSIGGSINITGGTATLASGFTLDEVDPLVAANNFQKGDLILRNFTQLGNTAQTLSIRNPVGLPSANNLRVFILNSTFNGTINYTFSSSFVNFSTFNNVTTFNKTTGGGGDDTFTPPHAVNTWRGGNHFLTTVNFNHFNTSTWVMGSVNGDIFEGDVNLYSDLANSPTLGSFFRLADGANSVFHGNINITQRVGLVNEIKVEFGRGGGTAEFRGSAPQSINFPDGVDDLAIKFGNLRMNNPDGLNLNFPATIFGNALLESGVINTTAIDSLTFYAGSTVTGASDASFIDGPVMKRGNTAFVFPVGDGNAYHPIAISAPADVNSIFRAQSISADHGLGSASDVSLVKVSDCEYWTLDRLAGADNPSATLYWNSPFCRTDYIKAGFEGDVRIARWSGVLWNNLGISNLLVVGAPDGTDGQLTTAAPLPDAASHTLTFGTVVVENAMPVTFSDFRAVATLNGANLIWQTSSELNNDYFTIERLSAGKFELLGKVKGSGTAIVPNDYQWTDTNPLPGVSYYRLKQTDFDGKETYSAVIALHLKIDQTPYPNPVKNTLYLDGLNFEEDSKLIVTDLTGQVMYSGEATESLDVHEFASGIYHLGVKGKKGIRWYSIRKE